MRAIVGEGLSGPKSRLEAAPTIPSHEGEEHPVCGVLTYK